MSNGVWRAEITWPNGNINHYGRFASERDAARWVARHQWLSKREMDPKPPKRSGELSQATKLAVDVATLQRGDCEPAPEDKGKGKLATALGRKKGLKGTRARAKRVRRRTLGGSEKSTG
jgi:hypothetical protein